MKVGIIGAGIAGIATAIRMANRGYEVVVFEANEYPGGKLSDFSMEGFRFDAGPSLFTMPAYVEDLFRLSKKNIQDYFQYEKLEVVCHYFWQDETEITAFAEVEKFAAEVSKALQIDGSIVKKALAESARKYRITSKVFLEQSLHQPKNFLTKDFLIGILNLPSLDIFRSMNAANQRLKHPKLIQLFNRYATYNGSNPYQAPGILNSIPHLEHGIGAFFPRGGMISITNALFNLAKSLNVDFRFNQKVEEIIIENNKVKGIKTNSQVIDFQLVVSNMDIFFTYNYLLPNIPKPTLILKQPKSSSAIIFYWGIRGVFPKLGLHNIFFSDDYKQEFNYLFNQKSISHDPTIYLNITQKNQPSDAPEGCENWFTMINAPHNTGQNWDDLIVQARKNILEKLSKHLKINLAERILTEKILDPRTIETRTAAHLGALYGNSSNSRMAAFLRHPNFSQNIKNLYFCGGSVHPGGGIPLALLSAKIVDDLLPKKI